MLFGTACELFEGAATGSGSVTTTFGVSLSLNKAIKACLARSGEEIALISGSSERGVEFVCQTLGRNLFCEETDDSCRTCCCLYLGGIAGISGTPESSAIDGTVTTESFGWAVMIVPVRDTAGARFSVLPAPSFVGWLTGEPF